MTDKQSEEFQGIVQCIPSFDNPSCTTKTIEFIISTILFFVGLVLLIYFLRNFSLRQKLYQVMSLILMQAYFITNIIYCFWNTVYELYSMETYFENMYFLCIVIYTIKSFLIKENTRPLMALSRNSNDSYENLPGSVNLFGKQVGNQQIYKWFYKSLTIVFSLLFTLIFITSLIGDIRTDEQREEERKDDGDSFFSFLKYSCEELWYLCVDVVCVLLSVIVMVVLCKNYRQETKRLKQLTLGLNYDSSRQRDEDDVSNNSRIYMIMPEERKLNNPLKKLWVWMGLNIFAEIVNLVESGLLLYANPQNQCRIIPNNQSSNELLKLFFTFLTVDLQFIVTVWFFYDSIMSQKVLKRKNQNLLSSYDYSDEFRVGNIQMNPSSSINRSLVSDTSSL